MNTDFFLDMSVIISAFLLFPPTPLYFFLTYSLIFSFLIFFILGVFLVYSIFGVVFCKPIWSLCLLITEWNQLAFIYINDFIVLTPSNYFVWFFFSMQSLINLFNYLALFWVITDACIFVLFSLYGPKCFIVLSISFSYYVSKIWFQFYVTYLTPTS